MESRSTWRERQTIEAWQHKRREERAEYYEKRGDPYKDIETDLKDAQVRPVTKAIAEKIILEYEWLGTMSPGTRLFYGIFFGEHCGGVVCIGHPDGIVPGVVKSYRVPNEKIAYLSRGACAYWTPKGSASKLISHALKDLRRKGYWLAIAFADEDAGEIGTVYQSTNWLYLGRTPMQSGKFSKQYVSPRGKIITSQYISSLARKNGVTLEVLFQKLKESGWREQSTNPKHRYLYILAKGQQGNAIHQRIEHLIQPYPKRRPESGAPVPTGESRCEPEPAAPFPRGESTRND